MSKILDAMADRVLLADGAMGSRVQVMNLDVERDYGGQENCTDILCRTRPDIVRDIHKSYYAAGSDAVTTNSFGTSPITLGEFGLTAEAFELSKRSAELAREAADSFKSDGRERFVLGDIGPGTKLPTLGHIAYQPLEDALTIQASGLLAGGADAFLIETCQDPLQIKAAVNGCKRAKAEGKSDIPIFVQVTVETTGTLLVGADIAAAATVVKALDVDLMGLNCATGPREMAEHVRWLGENWPGFISCQPNAGLPELVDGKPHYPLAPAELATWLERFVLESGVNMIGGCCGTTDEHIAALDGMLRRVSGNKLRPKPKPRTVQWVPSAASLYQQVPLRQENAYFSIGERCNANGSKQFRTYQENQDWDGCVEMGREQVREGSHALDICTAFVGRDEIVDMTEVVGHMRGSVTAPLVIDSTELPVLETALKLYGGKAILNSINFEDGEGPAGKRMELARRFGAAVIALTIEEPGMAKGAKDKLRIAKRLADFACGKYGLPLSDLLIDPLTFTIATGNEDDRKLGLETLDGIQMIREELPECQIILGLSNISFGLSPAARHVLNSVFLDHAVKRGMTGAIVHFSRIAPLHKIPEIEVQTAEDLIFDRRREGYDPLQAYLALFSGKTSAAQAAKPRPATVEERLKQRIVDGDRKGIDVDLADAMTKYTPLEIINTFLLDGMKVVGELFGAGKMQLPFVLQSAETMKAAVAYLEPHMERVEGQEKGTIVLATVKGDVHDIGKNLVDIILTNNGYKVVNLGIKQPLDAIITAAKEHKADAIGMSGLLVKSTVVMRENLEEMSKQGLDFPVLLGGAALTRQYVETDCFNSYSAKRVAYAGDAFDGLGLMEKVKTGVFDTYVTEQGVKAAARPKRTRGAAQAGAEAQPAVAPAQSNVGTDAPSMDARPVEYEESKLRKAELLDGVKVPTPPFFGPRIIERVSLKALSPFLNERMLYQFHWGFRKDGRRMDEYMAWARKELRPTLYSLLEQCAKDKILQPQAAYGYWKCAAEGDSLVLFDESGKREVGRFGFPRQRKADGLCIADFFRDVDAPERDVIGLQVVTVGQHASEVAREWFAADRYKDYLYLHGLGVEMTEALAEYVHKKIRADFGFAAEDARDMDEMLSQGYHGSRYSFGYPACPNLADQRQILELLGAGKIGIEMSDEDQLHPEQSTSAIVVHHPQAKYFAI
jgi:5-methyltetrahydrofolate--homocysteine methyltransferase